MKYLLFSNKKDLSITIGFAVLGLIMISGAIMDYNHVPHKYISKMMFAASALPVILFIAHGTRTLSFWRLCLFFLIPALTGFIFEYYGVKYGTVFGGQYHYPAERFKGAMICGMPIGVPIFWAVFIYTGYSISNSFLKWLGMEKPTLKNRKFMFLPLLIILDGMIVTALDIFMDPIMVYRGTWVWNDGGPFYGIPIGNFIGWFVVTAISMTIYRLFEFFKPQKDKKVDSLIFLLPSLGYGVLCTIFAIYSVKIGKPELAMIGIAAMLPYTVASVLCFFAGDTLKKEREAAQAEKEVDKSTVPDGGPEAAS